MFSRLALLLITLFWVTMTVLLWRSEFGGRNHLGSTVPLSLVWQKILTAPDSSSLVISHHGQKIGFCRWAAVPGQNTTSTRANSPDASPEGMVEKLSDYQIDFEGNAVLDEMANRLRFDLSVRFNTNHVWQDFRVRLNLRPSAWELNSRASEATVRLRTEDDEGKSERVIKFADLQNPVALARELELPVWLPPGTLGALALPRGDQPASPFSLGLQWEARNDWITIGHTSVRAYRLQARLLDRYQIVVLVSWVGEILRVELPDELVFVNDQLINL